jgi:hypothetical protein
MSSPVAAKGVIAMLFRQGAIGCEQVSYLRQE